MSTGSKWMAWLLSLAVLGSSGYFAYKKWYVGSSDTATSDAAGKVAVKNGAKGTGKGKGKGKGRGGRPVAPVAVAYARIGNLNIYQSGLGTVTPLNTVTVRSRVDGQLMRVLFTEGQTVKKGDLLAEIDSRPYMAQLLQVEGQMQRDQAQLANARVDLERYRLLLKQDSIAEQQVSSQQALVRQLEGTVKNGQGQVDSARLQVTYSRVTAPISGQLGLRQVDPGNIVRSGDPSGLVVITQFNPIAVMFTIPQDNLPVVLKRLRSGTRVPVEAWDREQKTLLASGRLLTADNQIDTATGTIRLKAEFPNDQALLFPNQFVNIRMLVDTRENAITVPTSSIQRGAQGLLVYVVNEDKTVSLRAVKTGVTEGARIEIQSGVQRRERVVIDGMDRLRDGMRVEVADRNRAGKGGGRGKGKGKGKGRRGKGGAVAGEAASVKTSGGDTGKTGTTSDDVNAGATAEGAAKPETADADARKDERRKRGDGEARKKKKDAEAAAQ